MSKRLVMPTVNLPPPQRPRESRGLTPASRPRSARLNATPARQRRGPRLPVAESLPGAPPTECGDSADQDQMGEGRTTSIRSDECNAVQGTDPRRVLEWPNGLPPATGRCPSTSLAARLAADLPAAVLARHAIDDEAEPSTRFDPRDSLRIRPSREFHPLQPGRGSRDLACHGRPRLSALGPMRTASCVRQATRTRWDRGPIVTLRELAITRFICFDLPVRIGANGRYRGLTPRLRHPRRRSAPAGRGAHGEELSLK
jgi:hypothetical protein